MSLWIQLIFSMLAMIQYVLVRPTSCSISLTFKCQSTVIVHVRPWQYLQGPYEIGSVHPSYLASVWVFSWTWIIRSLWILSWCQKPSWIYTWQPDFLDKHLPPKLRKWTKNRSKKGFLNLKKNLVINFSLNLFYNENFYYLLCSCTNPIFGKDLIPEI